LQRKKRRFGYTRPSGGLWSARLGWHRNRLAFVQVYRLAVALNSQPAVFCRHHHLAIPRGHFNKAPKPRNWNYGYVVDFHPDGHSVFGMKQGNVTLAKKNCHPVGISLEGSHGITAKYHAARATERNHGHTIVYLQAVTAKKCRVRQNRLAAHAGVRTARHHAYDRRTCIGQCRSNK
jgi:hypothetical protein